MRRKRTPIKISQGSTQTEPSTEPTLEDNTISQIKQQLTKVYQDSVDVESRDMKTADKQVHLLYIRSICDPLTVSHRIVQPFWESKSETEYEQYIRSLPNCQPLDDLSQAVRMIPQGNVAIFFARSAFLIEVVKVESASVAETSVESTVLGPHDAFTENVMTNLNLLRLRYQTPDLQVESKSIGKLATTRVVMAYDKKQVDVRVLEKLKKQLQEIDVDLLLTSGQLHRILAKKKLALFPILVGTERPDRAVLNLSKGRVIIFVDHTPLALIAPSFFADFFMAMDDQFQLPMVGRFLTILRFLGLFITISLPALYVGTVSFNPEFFRVQLALSIAGSRAGVPYPSFLEVIVMLLMMEFLTEASIRLPRAIGPAATTVGGLILGQAATQAGLVSNIMIIIVAAVAISNYVIPIATMNFAIRVMKYLLLFLATFYGLVGVVTGIVALVFYLANLSSFDYPYVKMFRKVGKS